MKSFHWKHRYIIRKYRSNTNTSSPCWKSDLLPSGFALNGFTGRYSGYMNTGDVIKVVISDTRRQSLRLSASFCLSYKYKPVSSISLSSKTVWQSKNDSTTWISTHYMNFDYVVKLNHERTIITIIGPSEDEFFSFHKVGMLYYYYKHIFVLAWSSLFCLGVIPSMSISAGVRFATLKALFSSAPLAVLKACSSL